MNNFTTLLRKQVCLSEIVIINSQSPGTMERWWSCCAETSWAMKEEEQWSSVTCSWTHVRASHVREYVHILVNISLRNLLWFIFSVKKSKIANFFFIYQLIFFIVCLIVERWNWIIQCTGMIEYTLYIC